MILCYTKFKTVVREAEECRLITLLFGIFMLLIVGKLLGFALKASWGLLKILFTVVFLPLILIGLILAGLLTFAVPVLVVLGLYAVLCSRRM